MYWGGGLQVFFEPFPKCSWGLFNIFFITFHPVIFYLYMTPLFLVMEYLSLGAIIHNTRSYVQQIKCIQLQQDDCIKSYDIKALITSVPIGPVIKIIQDQLEQEKHLKEHAWQLTTSYVCWNSIYWTHISCSRSGTMNNWKELPGVTHKPHSSQALHGKLWSQSPQHITIPPSLW